jgi:hypothetical protein
MSASFLPLKNPIQKSTKQQDCCQYSRNQQFNAPTGNRGRPLPPRDQKLSNPDNFQPGKISAAVSEWTLLNLTGGLHQIAHVGW